MKKDSSHARAAEPAIQAVAFLPPLLPFLVTESNWLRGKWGAFDFSFPVQTRWGLRWVHVDVDGEIHDIKPRPGEHIGKQQDRDRRKGSEALKQGRMLVRLHYRDGGDWGPALDMAASYAQQEQPVTFVIYTHSYCALGLATTVKAL